MRYFTTRCAMFLSLLGIAQATAIEAADPGETVRYGPGRKLGQLANDAIAESSGMACCRHTPGVFWTHNDSGDAARIYAFNSQGEDLGTCLLAGARARDWEDMASFTLGRKHYLLLGDTGDNYLRADVHHLYLIEEPPFDPRRGTVAQSVPVTHTISYRYEDGRHNCESVAVDSTNKTILLVAKELGSQCNVYALSWPVKDSDQPLVARKIATLKIPPTTGMDVSPDGRRAVVLTYGSAYEYRRGVQEDWATALARPPQVITLPSRRKGEAICYGVDGKTLYLTSEAVPAPLFQVPVKKP